MTPEQISVLNTIAIILERIGTWPVGSIFAAVVFGPWVMMYFISRAQERRFEAVAKMYENNVELVKKYESVASDLREIVIFNTQKMTEVTSMAENNLYCPMNRRQVKQRDIDIKEGS